MPVSPMRIMATVHIPVRHIYSIMESTKAMASPSLVALAAVAVVAVVVIGGAYVYLNPQPPGATSTTTFPNEIDGVVAGYVTVGPAQPVCMANQMCNVNMSGYHLVFAPACARSSTCKGSEEAVLSPSGHYSILLAPGNYTVIGLNPSCGWMGCSSAFPKQVTVQSGVQQTLDFSIDTGIR